jgi:hypothetical protein
VCDIKVEPRPEPWDLAGSLRGGCLPQPSRANVPVGRLPIGRSLPGCPTTAPSVLRAHTLGFPPLCQAIAPASTSMSHPRPQTLLDLAGSVDLDLRRPGTQVNQRSTLANAAFQVMKFRDAFGPMGDGT